MSNYAIVNGVAVNGTPLFSFEGVVVVFEQVVNEDRPAGVALEFAQGVGIQLSDPIVAVFEQDVQLQSSAGDTITVAAFEQSVIFSRDEEIVINVSQWVVDDA